MGRFIDRIRERRHPHDDGTTDPIKHVVLLMFENHSFDQMLGSQKAFFPQLEGIDPDKPRVNYDSKGNPYKQRPSNDTVVDPDPKHELEHILNQLKNGNSGFVAEYEREYAGKNPDLQRIMDYFPDGTLPALHELAKHFTICDHWYASVPGPTWTNRFFVHSGTSLGRVRMFGDGDYNPGLFFGYDQDTIYDRLNDSRSWRVYFGDVPQSLMLVHQRSYEHRQHYKELEQFFEDANGPEHDFPEFAFIEPRYFPLSFTQPQNDDHPPHGTMPAQELLADVYNAIRGNSDLWNSTLLVVLYDENGGFYDHVVPPAATPPDDYAAEYSFNQYGVRVPALLISPWVERRVISTPFDHTSLLRYVIEKWKLSQLTRRSDEANSIAEAISVSGQPRTDTPTTAPKPQMRMMATAPGEGPPEEEFNDLQRSLIELSKQLEAEAPAEAKARMMAVGPQPEGQVARQRVKAFLGHE